ncbi:MAG TPA: creatininase family protein [Candidatus Deferrimicrobium sp.]|nr:creatininase family protein [Candidatus Deferrimicrobium sp.]
MERQLQRLTSPRVAQLVPSSIDVIILPVGTVEAHGAACLGTDNVIPEALALRVADRINGLVAPTVSYGITRSLYRYPGGITLKPDTYASLVRDILSSLSDIGFKHVFIINGHGGNNAALKETAANFHAEHKSNIAVIHWWELCQTLTEEFFGHAGGHAGTDETAMAMAIDPRLVEPEIYTPDMAYQVRAGADVYPIPGTIILYKPGEGYPEFDLTKSREYFERVASAVGEFAELVLARWRAAGL